MTKREKSFFLGERLGHVNVVPKENKNPNSVKGYLLRRIIHVMSFPQWRNKVVSQLLDPSQVLATE